MGSPGAGALPVAGRVGYTDTTRAPAVQEVEQFMQLYEPVFYQHNVNLVLGGHLHSYERSRPVYNYTGVPACSPGAPPAPHGSCAKPLQLTTPAVHLRRSPPCGTEPLFP